MTAELQPMAPDVAGPDKKIDYDAISDEYMRITQDYQSQLQGNEIINELTLALRTAIDEKSIMREIFLVDKLSPKCKPFTR